MDSEGEEEVHGQEWSRYSKGGGGVLRYISNIGMYGPKGYGFCDVSDWKRPV